LCILQGYFSWSNLSILKTVGRGDGGIAMKITPEDKKVGAVMVIGAGIAGMQASLDLAASGYYVYLVDRSSTVGGMMAQIDKTFPTNECAM
jgi:heterodisulfide reductase subunit A-like polyferredoxin